MGINIHNLSAIKKIIERKRYLRPDFPYSYSISLGEYKCNRKCRMCPMYGTPPKKERYITDKIFERACMELGDRSCNLEISAYGETFMHPKSFEYLSTARRLCPKACIIVATNGAFLDRKRCEEIVDSGIDHLSFSLNAGTEKSYKWLTGADNYGQICRNLEMLVRIRNKRSAKHLKITTHIIGIKELSREFDDFIRRWSGITDDATVRNYGNWAGMVDRNEVTPAEGQKIPSKRYPCIWLWYATKIEPNGDVSKCFVHVTGDRDPLGNILKQGFESIWKGEKLRRLRELHCDNRYDSVELCKDCIVWSLFPDVWFNLKRHVVTGDIRWL